MIRAIGITLWVGCVLSSANAGADAVEEQWPALEELYQHLHQNPELSNKEFETSKFLAARLRTLDFAVTEGVGGTGVVAVMENGEGPTVLLRADMDALPITEETGLSYASKATGINQVGNEVGVMHACGHDVHMTVFMGTAERLVAEREKWSGTLVMILQPAEERGLGAKQMLGDGLFKRFPRPDFNLALHVKANLPAGHIGYSSGAALASVDSVDITVFGTGGHGAYPHTTKDPVVLAAQIVMALQTIVSREIKPIEPAVVTVGSIHGGTKHNIISDKVKLQLTLRSYSPKVRKQTIAAIRRITDGLGRAAGLPPEKLPEVKLGNEYTPTTYNNPKLTASMVPVFKKVVGAKRLHEVEPVMGGEDFSRYGMDEPKIPSMMFWLGAVPPEKHAAAEKAGVPLPSLHSPTFYPAPERTITTGVRTMTAAARSLLVRK